MVIQINEAGSGATNTCPASVHRKDKQPMDTTDNTKKEKRRASLRHWVETNREHIKAYRDATKERRNARRRELYQQDEWRRVKALESAKKQRIREGEFGRKASQYKIPADDLERMTNNGCAICGANPAFDSSVILHVDHDHATGKVRGILCANCNHAIGKMHNDPVVAASAMEYLLSNGVYHAERLAGTHDLFAWAETQNAEVQP